MLGSTIALTVSLRLLSVQCRTSLIKLKNSRHKDVSCLDRGIGMTFSQRNGIVKVRDALQVDSLDVATRNALWNLISPFLQKASYCRNATVNLDVWTGLYHEASDTVPNTRRGQYEYNVSDNELFYRFFREKIINGKWNECLDFIEFIADDDNRKRWNGQCYNYMTRRNEAYAPSAEAYNLVFEKNLVGYRFVSGEITPITSQVEIQAIENAIECSNDSVRELFSKALVFLSNRKSPDYAKSIECSISAVEAQCRILLGGDQVSLGQALKLLEKRGMTLHPALKGAFEKLYGFTSNADGIRHGGIKPSDVDQDLAKFMLISCSAFVNYLISKML